MNARRRWLVLVLVASVIIAGAGLLTTRWIRSPQQQLAEREPPALSVLTAEVERRVLSDTVLVRGTVRREVLTDVSFAASAGGEIIVSDLRRAVGEPIIAGDVMVEISGRPLLALSGQVPAYRDLAPGDMGADVSQLQQALLAMGYTDVVADGVYGSATKTAVAALYRDRGYQPYVIGDESQLDAAQRAVTAAERTLEAAAQELATDRAGPTMTGTAAVPSGTQASPPEVESGTDAQTRVRYATEDLAQAREFLAQVEEATGAALPRQEVVFVPLFPARIESYTTPDSVPTSPDVGDLRRATGFVLSSGPLRATAIVAPGQRALLAEGQSVELTSELLGLTAQGVISSIGGYTPGDAQAGHLLTIVPATGELPDDLVGQDVRLTVTAAATATEVLVVPVTALSSGPDGRPAVVVLGPDGEQVRVEVRAGASGDGYVEVTPRGGSLEPGDLVVVGAAPRVDTSTPTPT